VALIRYLSEEVEKRRRETYAEGDKVIVIGAPEGLQGTMSDGIISAIKNQIGKSNSPRQYLPELADLRF
jgi:S1-C subfamily serine protease